MKPRFLVHVETTSPTRLLLPWVTVNRRGRQSIESQCFGIFGYPESELSKLPGAEVEKARDTLELALRLFSAFEYIPKTAAELEGFFEKKILGFEQRLQSAALSMLPLHAVIGVIQDTTVLFASSGDILALQMNPTHITNLGEPHGGAAFHFDTFRSGNLTPATLLLFIPKTIGTQLKSDELKRLTLARSSERKLDYLSHILEKRALSSAVCPAVLLEARPKLERPVETTAVSIANLINTENATEELLSPPLLKPLTGKLQAAGEKYAIGLKQFFNKLRETAKTPAEKTPTLPAFNLSARLQRLTDHLQTRAQTRAARFKTSAPRLWRAETWLPYFNALPAKSKIRLIVLATCLFIFLQSVLIIARHGQINAAEATLQNELTEIRGLIDSTQAALLYPDEEKARDELANAQTRIQALPELTRQVTANISLRALYSNRFASPKSLKELEDALLPLQNALRHAIVIAEPTIVDETTAKALALGGGSFTDVRFGKRRYALLPEQNQILRYEPKGEAFDQGTAWIKDGTNVAQGVALAVDGSVYVLEKAGQVTEFRKGLRANFALKPTDPPLTSGIKLWTDENSNYLYILDGVQRRLLVFAKRDGLLKAQYTSPKFTDLKNFVIDETKRTAYLLDGSSTLSIPLSPLTSR